MIHVPTRIDMIRSLTPANSIGAEIGVYRGDFSQQIMEQTRTKMLYLVDPWQRREDYRDSINLEDQEGHMRETQRKMRPYIGQGRCKIIRGFSLDVAEFDRSIPPLSWIFIDGFHAYGAALPDLFLWSERLTEDGTIFLHDYFRGPKGGASGDWFSGVPKAVDKFIAANPEWTITHMSQEDLPTVRLARE